MVTVTWCLYALLTATVSKSSLLACQRWNVKDSKGGHHLHEVHGEYYESFAHSPPQLACSALNISTICRLSGLPMSLRADSPHDIFTPPSPIPVHGNYTSGPSLPPQFRCGCGQQCLPAQATVSSERDYWLYLLLCTSS
ncbi:hypothetical protein EDD15DRAFT_2341802 [Pisolithus albus]|nr:hypothetical protein EDD15DRAFT_2341802 [Pisolithus albus]